MTADKSVSMSMALLLNDLVMKMKPVKREKMKRNESLKKKRKLSVRRREEK
jgi:hypothetical protein